MVIVVLVAVFAVCNQAAVTAAVGVDTLTRDSSANSHEAVLNV